MVTKLGGDFPKTWQPENGFRNDERETVLVLGRTEAALLIFCRRVRCFPRSPVSQTRFQRRRTQVKNPCARLLWHAVKNICRGNVRRKQTSRRVVITIYREIKISKNLKLKTIQYYTLARAFIYILLNLHKIQSFVVLSIGYIKFLIRFILHNPIDSCVVCAPFQYTIYYKE